MSRACGKLSLVYFIKIIEIDENQQNFVNINYRGIQVIPLSAKLT